MGRLKIPLDFEGVGSGEVDAGVYAAVIENLKYRPEVDAKDSRDGKPKSAQVAVEYTITEEGDFQGEKLWQNLYMTPKNMFRVKAFFDVFGEDYKELVVDEESGIVLEPDLSGLAVEVKTFIDGKWGNKIDEPPVLLGKKRSARKAAEEDDEDDSDDDEQPRRRGRAVRR